MGLPLLMALLAASGVLLIVLHTLFHARNPTVLWGWSSIVQLFALYVVAHGGGVLFRFRHHPLGHQPCLMQGDARFVFGFVHEELIDVFDGPDAEFSRLLGKIEVVELVGEQRLVQRPLGQTQVEQRPGRGPHPRGASRQR